MLGQKFDVSWTHIIHYTNQQPVMLTDWYRSAKILTPDLRVSIPCSSAHFPLSF